MAIWTPGADSDSSSASLARYAACGSGRLSSWSALPISAFVTPPAPAHVIASAARKLAGETIRFISGNEPLTFAYSEAVNAWSLRAKGSGGGRGGFALASGAARFTGGAAGGAAGAPHAAEMPMPKRANDPASQGRRDLTDTLGISISEDRISVARDRANRRGSR